jgi:SulP family sulfate permease
VGPPRSANRLTATITVGVIGGMTIVAVTLSLVSLIFAGGMDRHLATGATLFLLGATAMNLVAARGTSLEGSILVPQDATSTVVAVTAASILPAVAASEQLGTLLAFGFVATAAAGAFMLLLGVTRMGNLIRFVPYPVIGGFMAGTGWLMVTGAAGVVTSGFQWSAASVVALAGASAFAITMVALLRYRPSIRLFPLLIVGGIVVFYVALAVSGTSIEEARALGLLPSTSSSGLDLPLAEVTSVDWEALRSGVGGLVTIPLIATLALLLNVTGLELVADREADLNRELRAVGGANLLASVTGSAAGYQALSVTALGYRVGVFKRGVTVVCALVCLAAAIVGPSLVAMLPTPLVGGLLLALGLGFLVDWLVDGRRRMTGPEYLLLLAMVAAVAFFGFLAAVLLGMGASVALFAVAYSQIDPIRHVATAAERRSSHERSRAEQEAISARSDSLVILELQGYLFFGTARALVDRVQALVDVNPSLSCLVIDLRRVQGVDSTGLASFLRLLSVAERHGFRLILSQPPETLSNALTRATSHGEVRVTTTPNLDSAIEMAENHLLAEVDISPDLSSLADVFGEDLWARIEPHLSRHEVPAGSSLADHGEDTTGLFLVEWGRIAAEIPTEDGRWQRVLSSGPGTVFGEMSLYLTGGRTARLRAEEDSCVYTLDAVSISAVEVADPETALELHRRLAGVLARRLSLSNEALRAVLQ